VSECQKSGVSAYDGAHITFTGVNTKVHTNCLQENNNYCGVIVSDKMIQITIEALQT